MAAVTRRGSRLTPIGVRWWRWRSIRPTMLPASAAFVRQFSRKCSPNLRKINAKVPPQEATAIAAGLYRILKDHGPLTVPHTWNHAKEAGINGLNSKTHMKIMLKWMRGWKLLKLFCTHVGSSKKFFHSVLPEEPPVVQGNAPQTATYSDKKRIKV